MTINTKASIENYHHWIALGSLGLLGLILGFTGLADFSQWGNEYYQAAVKSMMGGWDNFFFGSLDSTGFISVDKPPLGLWLQTISAQVFGFGTFALVLPQVLGMVISSLLIYKILQKRLGLWAGIMGGLLFLFTPIVVAASRNNTMDMVLLAFLVGSVYAVLQGVEEKKPLWVLGAFALIGLGFLTKMLQAYTVLPAVLAVVLLARNWTWGQKGLYIALGLAVTLLVSFSWIWAVELIPGELRPWVGSSSGNSALELVFGHNGITRILGASQSMAPSGTMLWETGEPGLIRLWNRSMIGQGSLFLLSALLLGMSMIPLVWQKSADKAQRNLLIVSMAWLIPLFVYFSFSGGLMHRYYLVLLAPAIALIIPLGVGHWKSQPVGGIMITLAALAALGTAAACLIYEWSWEGSLPIVLILVVLALSAGGFYLWKGTSPGLWRLIIALLMVVPMSWSLTPLLYSENRVLPYAGPELAAGASSDRPRVFGFTQETKPGPGPAIGAGTMNTAGLPLGPPNNPSGNYQPGPGRGNEGEIPGLNPAIDFLQEEEGHFEGKYLAAAKSAKAGGSRLILETQGNILTVGGFSGSDAPLSLSQFIALVDGGELGFYLYLPSPQAPDHRAFSPPNASTGLTQSGGGPRPPDAPSEAVQTIEAWVLEYGQRLETSSRFGVQLYDLRGFDSVHNESGGSYDL
jgi:4-amino-4-deoxy-L-arabinose transferase-like glycosyltransferase